IGKPVDREQCRRILSTLSGREHRVMSAVSVALENDILCRLSTNLVSFKKLSNAEIDRYCASEEPMDKAGAYAIQGRAAIFIEYLAGSYSSVMGLPLYETAELLHEAGISV
ncbi:MAG: septum formation inhibitor Maf, partial [Gammaproteobacteria bacterium]|nr:septum formation inhibitor Maf [Gammaproteobacteria bacterium]